MPAATGEALYWFCSSGGNHLYPAAVLSLPSQTQKEEGKEIKEGDSKSIFNFSRLEKFLDGLKGWRRLNSSLKPRRGPTERPAFIVPISRSDALRMPNI